ncbi:MAG: ferrous iron transport protein A [Planctomycetales bacterium]|nr:ferrous iron transport protein A [Planctomycetales bacterium]
MLDQVSMNLVPLELLKSGERAEILEVDGGSEDVHRLAELGIQSGAAVEMVQPGTPCILTVNDRRFTLRLDPAVMVLVRTA